jgi:SHS2 domain-containing protein
MESKNSKHDKFEYLEHTADVKFRAYGKDLEEQFGNAALAMFGILTDTSKIKKKLNKSISVNGNDLKALLYNFLEELLFLIDTEGFLLNLAEGIKIHRINNRYSLSALLSGDKAENYETAGDIKAVTYAEMEITPEYVQVVLDL